MENDLIECLDGAVILEEEARRNFKSENFHVLAIYLYYNETEMNFLIATKHYCLINFRNKERKAGIK